MEYELRTEVIRLLAASAAIDKAATQIYIAMVKGKNDEFDLDRFVALSKANDGAQDFKIAFSGRRVLAKFSRFTRKVAATVQGFGRYRFYLFEDDPLDEDRLVEDPIFEFEFSTSGQFSIGSDDIHFRSDVTEYHPQYRNIILMNVVENVHKHIFE